MELPLMQLNYVIILFQDKFVIDYTKADFEKYCKSIGGCKKNHSIGTLASYNHRLRILFNFLQKQNYIRENIITE